jgi:hypothetical protein
MQQQKDNKNQGNKVKLANLSERDAYYEFWWSKGGICPRRVVWVDAKKYATFKKQSKGNAAKTGFLASSS